MDTTMETTTAPASTPAAAASPGSPDIDALLNRHFAGKVFART